MSNDNRSPEEIKSEEVAVPEVKEETPAPAEAKPEQKDEVTLGELASEPKENKADSIPLKKYMEEKNARKQAEAKAKELQDAIDASSGDDTLDKAGIKELSEKHGISEDVVKDLIKMSAKATRAQVKAEIEEELSPQMEEIEKSRADKAQAEFDTKLTGAIDAVLKDSPEFADAVDREDVKSWIQSGKYSKLTLSQLMEQKYGKFVKGNKKPIEDDYKPDRTGDLPDTSKMTDEDYLRLDKDPALREKWAKDLPNRLRGVL